MAIATNVLAALPAASNLLKSIAIPFTVLLLILSGGLIAWEQRISDETPGGKMEWDSDRSPYPGLDAFAEKDSGVFFGREEEAYNITAALRWAISSDNQVLTIVGPSGAGKSSLINAGVIPALRKSRRRWIIVGPFVPGDHPIANLAHALQAAMPTMSERSPTARANVSRSSIFSALSTLRRSRSYLSESILLIVDQAEELFSQTGIDERNEFLSLLRDITSQVPKTCSLVVMRSEFLTSFLESAYAGTLRNVIAIGSLSSTVLIDVIARPATIAGIRFEPPSLVQEIAADAGDGRALPLLAYLMQELYERAGKDKLITRALYDEMGGVKTVLARQADQVRLTAIHSGNESAIFSTLLKFVALSESGEPTRRRVHGSTLSGTERAIVDDFITARLLTSDSDSERSPSGEIIEVTHEALFQHWAPLRQEIATNWDTLRGRTDLERWAKDWVRFGRLDSYLLAGDRLKIALGWAQLSEHLDEPAGIVRAFLDTSRKTDQATMQNLSESIARQSLAISEHDPDLSLTLAVTAYSDCWPTSVARRALTVALGASRVRLVLRGHQGAVRSVAWSPDNAMLATASDDGTARVWNANDGSEIAVIRGHEDGVRAVAWSPDGRLLATASYDQTTRIWSLFDDGLNLVLSGHRARIRSLSWSPDGNYLATASDDYTAKIWRAEDGTMLGVLRGHEGSIRSIAWSPDGAFLVTGSHDCSVRIWEFPSFGLRQILTGHHGGIWSVACSPDSKYIASASYDCTTRIWRTSDGVERHVFRGHEGGVRSVCWSPDAQRVATGSYDRTIHIRTINDDGPVVLRGHSGGVLGVSWSPGGTIIASASYDHTARVWQSSGEGEVLNFGGHADGIRSLAWSPNGHYVLSGSYDRTACIWRVYPTNRESVNSAIVTLVGHDDGILEVDWSPDGHRIVTVSDDRSGRIWDSLSGKVLQVLEGHDDGVWGVDWAPDGSRIVTASDDRTARIWDSRTGIGMSILEGHTDGIRRVAWSPNGLYVATASDDRTARIWDCEMSAEVQVLQGHEDGVQAVAWSPDGRYIATGSYDNTVRIWDIQDGRQVMILRGHDDGVQSVAWSPDGHHIATGSYDRTLRIWDREGNELAVLGVHRSRIDCVSWNPDGKLIATASYDRTVKVWEANKDIDHFLTLARARMVRQLTSEERHGLMLPD